MKKVLLFVLLLSAITATAQEIELNEQGAYERKEVIRVEGVTATTLYDRAMIALSEWTGQDGRSSAGLDYHERDAGIVIYKGHYFLDSKNKVNVHANFTLRIRCKDGRSQVSVTIPSITAKAVNLNLERTGTVLKLKESKKKSAKEYLNRIQVVASSLITAMNDKLKANTEDDDF